AMQNYLELHRHAAVAAEILGQRDLALRLVTAHLIAGSTLWRIEPEPQKAHKDITKESLTASTAMAALNKERDAVFALLGMEPADTLIRHGWRGLSTLDIYAKLWPLKTDEVVRMLTYAMAESLAVGSSLVEAIGKELNVDMADHWQPDDAFWTLLQGRNTVNAVLADVAGKTVADQNITIKLAAQKDIARDCLTGSNGRQKVEGWLPRWMRFPFRTYTSNGGTRIEEAVKKVEALKATS
ncbi:MAG: chromosome partitioning protein ParB, partial [Geminicoccaceae bacterium]